MGSKDNNYNRKGVTGADIILLAVKLHQILVIHTVLGAAELLKQSGKSPAELRAATADVILLA